MLSATGLLPDIQAALHRRLFVSQHAVQERLFDGVVHRPSGEQVFGAQEFGRFRDDDRAAVIDEAIGRASDGGIGGKSGRGVRAAALHAQCQRGGRQVLPPEVRGLGDQRGCLLHPFRRRPRWNRRSVAGSRSRPACRCWRCGRRFWPVLYSSRPDDQCACQVRIPSHAAQRIEGDLEITAELPANEQRGDGNGSVHRAADGARDRVDVVHDGNDADPVADSTCPSGRS